MTADVTPDPLQILKSSKNILLVDWPDPNVPRSLLNAGFTVLGFSPDGYSSAKLVANVPEGQKGFPPRNQGEQGCLVFQKLETPPDFVDIVNVYRPEAEHAGIIQNHALPLKATVLWLHPPITSVLTRNIASENGLTFIEGVDIAETAGKI